MCVTYNGTDERAIRLKKMRRARHPVEKVNGVSIACGSAVFLWREGVPSFSITVAFPFVANLPVNNPLLILFASSDA